MEMNKSTYKRKRIDVPSAAPEDASSFYKRLGLDILAPSSTSGQPEETEPPRKRSVQQASHIALQNTKPTHRPDRVGQQWTQFQQRDRHSHAIRQNYPHGNGNSGRTESVSTAASYRPQHSQQTRPHEHQIHARTSLVNGGANQYQQHRQPARHEYQTHQKADLVNGGDFRRHQDVHPNFSHPRTASRNAAALHRRQHLQPARHQQRAVRKEPRVIPINRYAPPDYMKIMYHPTPTLEDLGLTSYLDSPPSSPRATSPVRESTATSDQETTQALSGNGLSMPTLIMPKQMTERPQTVSGNNLINNSTTSVRPPVYVPSFAPKGWVKPAEARNPSQGHGHTDRMEGSHVTQTMPSSYVDEQTVSKSAKPAVQTISTALVNRPKKVACDWSTIAEQYSTESRQSDNQEARRDAVYGRYNGDVRLSSNKETHDAERCKNQETWRRTNNTAQIHPSNQQTFDQIMAQQKARQNVRQQQLETNIKYAQIAGVKVNELTSSETKGKALGNMYDLFGGMSPFSCWIQSPTRDPRFS
ncbi:uncharacterized protein LOC133192903 [Saccostrea echinata]|uniref:uncharacterized protein LOC133192903 n=1 Tax=Saccostrea echinata TaxID=191078 RepID=UPI002A83202B|nr:uncharacterized protein LOC133192903 [Saccostrea echinata]